MANNSYSTIFVNYREANEDILTTQLKMLKERFHSFVVLLVNSKDDSQISDKNAGLFDDEIEVSDMDQSAAVIEYSSEKHLSTNEIMCIGVAFNEDSRLKEKGFEIKDPNEMAESYKKAMEMLQKMINPLGKK